MAWATGGKNIERRSRRNLARFAPNLKPADRDFLDTAGHETYWDYYLLQLLLKQQLIDLATVTNLIEASIIEVCFDILQQEALETTHYQTVYAGANFLWSIENTPLKGLVWKPAPIFAIADQAWQEWQAAKLGLCNPNHAPVLRAKEKVRQHTSEKVYRSFCKGFNGDRSLRDLACLMKKDLLRISKSLLPYIRRGWIELVETTPPQQRSQPATPNHVAAQSITKQAITQKTQTDQVIAHVEHQEIEPKLSSKLAEQDRPIAIVKPNEPATELEIKPAPEAPGLELLSAAKLEANSQPANLSTIFPAAVGNPAPNPNPNNRNAMQKRQNRWHQRKKNAAPSKFQELKIAFLDPDEVELDSPFQEVQPGQNQDHKPQAELAPPQPPLIACIDDSRAIGLLMRDIITKAGYRFVYIEDPLKAIATLKDAQPSLIFLDLIMPGATGFQVCAQLRRLPEFKDLPVIMLTSNRGVIDRIHARWVRTSEYLNKPVKAAQILETIATYLPGQMPLPNQEQPDSGKADVIPLVDRSQLGKPDPNIAQGNGL
jgi:CheY-like chemotaxis protein